MSGMSTKVIDEKQPDDVKPEDVDNGGQQEEDKPEKTFTQTELDAIIEKRLARVKSEKPADYDDLLEIALDLEEYGFVGTAAEKRAAVKAAKAKNKADRELKELEEEAEKTGHSPEILKKLKDAEKKLKEKDEKLQEITDVEETKRKEKEAKEKEDGEWTRQYGEFVEKHQDVDIDELIKDKKFLKYAKKHTGELTEIYEDYAELMEETSQSVVDRFKRSESRSTGGGKNTPASGSTKLDSSQQKTLDDWNKRYPHMKMTPQEFLK